MSLGKLLSMSRSFVAGKNDLGRYRLVEQGMLPRFGLSTDGAASGLRKKDLTTQNAELPLAAALKVDPPAANPARPAQGGVAGNSQPEAVVVAQAPAKEHARVVEAPASTDPLAVAVREPKSKSSNRLALGFDRLINRWFRTSSNPFRKRSGQPLRGDSPQQAELVLDSVKVMRNDLGDADFEVVQAKVSATALGQGAGRAILSAPVPSRIESSRLSSRLGAGRSRA